VQATYAQNGEARSVPMHDVLTATLKAIRINATVDGSVFCNRNGIPCQLLCSTFETAVQKAWLADFIFHDLCHIFASRLVMSGVALPTVWSSLGESPSNFRNRNPSTPQRASISY
jgi:hypothetical protein